MKRTLLLIPAVLLCLVVVVGCCDAPATVESEGIVVTVDANGNADGGHQFTKIDDSTFVIDGIKYTIKDGNLEVSGYDDATFTGVASIISKLNYNGQTFDVVSIGREAFYNCSSLTSITIGNGITSIGNRAFLRCDSLTSVTIPESVTSIGNGVFSNCSSLTSITIPGGVTSIEWSAFYACSSLTSITIPDSVTSIGNWAFEYCTNLTSITIGSGVTSIGDRAFEDFFSLTDVYCYAENVPSTDSDVFDRSPISSATLHVPAGSVDAYKAKFPWKNFGSIVAIEEKK